MEAPILKFNLVFLRKRAGWTQLNVATKLGVHKTSVQDWEHGNNTPTLHMCIKLSKLFQVRLDYLVTLDLEKVDPLYLELHRRNNNVSLSEIATTEQVIDTDILNIASLLHKQELKIPALHESH